MSVQSEYMKVMAGQLIQTLLNLPPVSILIIIILTSALTASTVDSHILLLHGNRRAEVQSTFQLVKRSLADFHRKTDVKRLADLSTNVSITTADQGPKVLPETVTLIPQTPQSQVPHTVTGQSLRPDAVNCTYEVNGGNSTVCSISKPDDSYFNSILKQMSDNKEMLLRTLYVTLGVTGLVVVYFVARAIWIRRRRTKSRKYKIIAQGGDHGELEMEPLGDGNDEDDDYTVFEVNGRKK